MLVSECRECGERYYGWALQAKENQYCSKCGNKLIVCNEADGARAEPKDTLPVVDSYSSDRGLRNITAADQYSGDIDFEVEFRHWLKL